MTDERIIAELIAAVEWASGEFEFCSQSHCHSEAVVAFWIDSDGQPMPVCAEDVPGSGRYYMLGDSNTPGYVVDA